MSGETAVCRPQCGACCIAPTIVQPYFGMPEGKAAGVRCIHLDSSLACGLFGDSRRPAACDGFLPHPDVCGSTREEAITLLTELEVASRPES